MLFSNKKGVSPLVATMLLIAFAIALGAVVINLGANVTTADPATQGKASKCDNVNFEIIGKACYNPDTKQIKVSINNRQESIDLYGLNFGIQTEEDYFSSDDNEALKYRKEIIPDQKQSIFIPYNRLKQGQIKEMRITPIIKEDEVCLRRYLSVTEIKDCSTG